MMDLWRVIKCRNRYGVAVVGLMLALVACGPIVPAQTPPQLAHTPGAPIVIDEQWLSTDDFRLQYPAGWRVVKLNVTGSPLEIVFAGPDDSLLIRLNRLAASDKNQPDTAILSLVVRDTGATQATGIVLSGQAPPDLTAELDQIMRQMAASVQFD